MKIHLEHLTKIYSASFSFPISSPVTSSELSHNRCYRLRSLVMAVPLHLLISSYATSTFNHIFFISRQIVTGPWLLSMLCYGQLLSRFPVTMKLKSTAMNLTSFVDLWQQHSKLMILESSVCWLGNTQWIWPFHNNKYSLLEGGGQ